MSSSSDTELVPLINGPVVSVAAVRLLCSLEDRGIDVAACGARLAIRPRSALTDADVAALTRWKRHVLALIAYMDSLPALPDWVQ